MIFKISKNFENKKKHSKIVVPALQPQKLGSLIDN
jgi:hypothetical protein